MQKFIDRADLQIKSAIALDHLKNYIYVEAEKEAHVKEVWICSICHAIFCNFLFFILEILITGYLVYSGLQRSKKYIFFSKNYARAYKGDD